MNVFVDTNVLVSAVAQDHESHERAIVVLNRVQSGLNNGTISTHTIAEMYSVLTKLPPPMRHSPDQAVQTIQENVVKHFNTVSLSATDYLDLVQEAALMRIQGGTIYDALLLKCAEKAKVEKIFTFNLRHFQNIASQKLASIIAAP